MHDCCTVLVFVSHVVMVGLANVEMVLPNLSWKQNGYGNIVVTVASRIEDQADEVAQYQQFKCEKH